MKSRPDRLRPRLTSLAPMLAAGALALPACESSIVDGEAGGGGQGGAPTTTESPAAGAGGASTNTSSAGETTTMAGGSGGTTTGTTTGTTMTGDPWAGPVEHLKELDMGSFVFGLQKPFPIPDKTLGLTVQVEAAQPDDIVGVYRLRPPVGNSVVLDFAIIGKDTQVFGGPGVVGAANPQTDIADAWPVKAGDWKVTTGSDGNAGDEAHVRVWVRRTNDGAFHGGALDINLFVVPGVASQSYLNQVVDAFFPYVGLEMGTINVYTADSSFSTLNSRQEYQDMLAATSTLTDLPAINLFVVDDFADSAFGGAIGVAGGVPGSPMRHGTRQSGLAYEPSGDPGYDATVLMHEIGHVGGLFHTTEFQIAETDALADTPECAPDTIQNNPGSCPDNDNVMFPMAYGATSFTGSQNIVLQGSAMYRGVLDEGGSPEPPFLVAPGAGAPPLLVASATSPLRLFAGEALDAGLRTMPLSPDPLERALGALACGASLDATALAVARDPAANLKRSTPKSATARLRAIVLDTSAPVLLRKRALELHVRAAKAEGALDDAIDTALALAASSGVSSIAERRLKAAALRVLLAERAALTPSLVRRVDRVLRLARASSDVLVASVAVGK